MRYTVTRQVIRVVGQLWMGGTAATSHDLSAYDMKNIGDPTKRDDVATWIALHMGDFARVDDFSADFHIGEQHIEHEWEEEESEYIYGDCMYPTED